MFALPARPATAPMLTIFPPLAASIFGTTARAVLITDFALRSSMRLPHGNLVHRMPHAEASGDIAQNVDTRGPNRRHGLRHRRCVEQIGAHQDFALIVAPKGGPQNF